MAEADRGHLEEERRERQVGPPPERDGAQPAQDEAGIWPGPGHGQPWALPLHPNVAGIDERGRHAKEERHPATMHLAAVVFGRQRMPKLMDHNWEHGRQP